MTWYEIFPQVLNMSLTASVIIVFVLILRLLLKRASKIYSYVLWSVVLFRLLCPVSLSAPVSILGIFDVPVVESTADTGEMNPVTTSTLEYIPSNIVHDEYPEVTLPVPVVGDAISEAVNENLPQGWVQKTFDPLEAPVTIATYLWMFGILCLFGYGIVSYLKLRQKLVGALKLRENIYLADHIRSPFVMGILRPRIYLPSNLDEQELKYIILHEQHHIRRRDPVLKMLAFVALCIHWFNPLVWAAFVLSAKDMEMSCDEAVVRKLGEEIRADYSASLLQLATGRRILFGTPLAFGEGEPADRIRNLARFKRPTIIITLIAALLCVVGIILCVFNPVASHDSVQVKEPDTTSGEHLVEYEEQSEEASSQQTKEFIEANTETPSQDTERVVAEDELLIGDVVLTRQPVADKVSVRVQPSVLRNYISYYYTPEGEDQQWLQDYLNTLSMEGEAYSRRWEGIKETGWQIAWQDKQFMVFEGGYLYYSYRDESQGMMEIFVEEPKLCDYIQIMLQEKIGYHSYEPKDIQGIVSAKLEVQSHSTNWEYYSQTITEKAVLEKLENWFGNGQYLFGGAECCNEKCCLELTLQSGKAIRLNVATDSCPNFGINGVYYDYQPASGWDNREFFELFDEIPWSWMEEGSISGALNETLKEASLLEEDALFINSLLEEGTWNDGATMDCLCDWRIIIGEEEILYHSDCGIFNDYKDERFLSLNEEMQEKVDAMLKKYWRMGSVNLLEEESSGAGL